MMYLFYLFIYFAQRIWTVEQTT